jgi:hypothetical protein
LQRGGRAPSPARLPLPHPRIPETRPLSPSKEAITISSPVTPKMLRGDWEDRPGLTDDDKAALVALPDEQLQEALDTAFERTGYQTMWFQILDETRGDATRALLDQLGRDSSAT